MTTWTVWCDGSAIPNPGRMGLGAVMVDVEGGRHELSESPQGVGCNNEAELRAVTLALAQLKKRGATTIALYSDSTAVVEQLGGSNVAPMARLAVLIDAARALVAGFERVDIAWIPRARNAQADRLARAALGAGPKQRKAKHMRARR